LVHMLMAIYVSFLIPLFKSFIFLSPFFFFFHNFLIMHHNLLCSHTLNISYPMMVRHNQDIFLFFLPFKTCLFPLDSTSLPSTCKITTNLMGVFNHLSCLWIFKQLYHFFNFCSWHSYSLFLYDKYF